MFLPITIKDTVITRLPLALLFYSFITLQKWLSALKLCTPCSHLFAHTLLLVQKSLRKTSTHVNLFEVEIHMLILF